MLLSLNFKIVFFSDFAELNNDMDINEYNKGFTDCIVL